VFIKNNIIDLLVWYCHTRFVFGLTAATPVPAPMFDVAENRSPRIPLPSRPIAGLGCESEVQMAENEDSDVAAHDNDVLF